MITQQEIIALNKEVQVPLFLTYLGADPKAIRQLGNKPEYRCNCWFRGGDNPNGLGVTYNFERLKWYCTDFTGNTFSNLDLLDFAVKLGNPFRKALDLLIFCSGKDNGYSEGNTSYSLENGIQGKLEHPVPMDPSIYHTFEKGLHPYWYGRGFTPEIAEKFRLGWCTHGELKDRLTIPIFDEAGRLVAIQSRAMDDRTEPRYKYLSGTGESAKLTLYNYGPVYNTNDRGWVGVVEGAAAVWRAHQYGYKNFLGTLSTTFTKRQIDLLMHLNQNIVIMYDFDATPTMSGQIASIKLANHLLERGHKGVYICNIGFHSDPEDLTMEQFTMTLKNSLHYK